MNSDNKLIVNRYMMKRYGVSKDNITFIQKKSLQLAGVYPFDKMIRDEKNRISAIRHFDINKMIEAQKLFTSEVRSMNVARNKQILTILEDIRIKLLIEKEAAKFNPINFDEIVSIFKDKENSYFIADKPLEQVFIDLRDNGYSALPF